ncbi:MAG: CxxxxCH/CxxCH domain-containing protein [Lewinellaceae bacterium]|nr:CxxxxCH/CxxCH domain-containing protein [Saprospiraceae bacterium]MCB9271125.1 CxxxxCH/CxxCH domain-containing protein [Lewinellaceae bacterium]
MPQGHCSGVYCHGPGHADHETGR